MSALQKVKEFFKKFYMLIFVVLAIVILSGTIGISVVYLENMTASLWSQIVTDITEVTAQGGYAFETYLAREVESIEILADNLKGYNFDDPVERQSALDLFDMYSASDGYFTLVVYDKPEADENCTIYLALTHEEKEQMQQNGEQRIGTPYLKSEFADYGDSGISNVYYNMYTGQKTLAYYKKFTFANNLQAIVRKGQILNQISDRFSLSFYDNSGFSYITKSDGDIVIRSNHPKSNRTSKNLFRFFVAENGHSDQIDALKTAMHEGKAGAMLATEGGADRVISFIPIKNTDNWYIISVIPNEAISNNVDDIIHASKGITVIIIVVVIIFLLFSLVMYFSRRKIMQNAAEVKHREQLFSVLASNTDDVFIMLPHGSSSAEYISPNISRVMGLEEGDIKRDIGAIGRPENCGDGEDYGLTNISRLNTGETLNFDSERINKQTGETHFYRETVYSVSIDGVDKDIIVFSDRTKEKLSEAALKEAMETARAASVAKSAFLSSMSHDIRTPMNAIVGMTNIATKHIDDKERVKDCLNKITMSSNHLLTLINDVLDISKIESGKLTLSPIVFSLRDVITNLVNIVRPQVSEKQLEFNIHINKVEYEYIFADMLRINQIFINILSNSIKYTPSGGKVIMDITQEVVEKDKTVRLIYVVQDTGIGMSPEFMATMYETFSRAQDSRTNNIQGTGLGLSIVKQMVGLMNGTIDCESELNKGTKFTITLDLPVGKKLEKKKQLPDLNILVIDDDEMFLESVQDVIEDMGAHIDTAHSGTCALEMIKDKKNKYSVIIVDWKMPEMSGIDTIKEIHKLVHDEVPIILVSSYDWEDIAVEAKLSGVNGFINKPVFRSYIYEELCKVLKLNGEDKEDTADEDDDLSGIKILVAEDNDLNWEVMTELLDMYGIKTTRAENGKIVADLMENAADGAYDLILMDVQMPVMNGKDATRAIRNSKRPYVRDIPIIAMTADAFAEDIAACLEAGMNGHLAKPVDIDKLCQEIKKFVSKTNL